MKRRYNPTAHQRCELAARLWKIIGECLLFSFFAALFVMVILYGVVTAPTMQRPYGTMGSER